MSRYLREPARVPLSLEIGVIGVETCGALDDVLVDVWVSQGKQNE